MAMLLERAPDLAPPRPVPLVSGTSPVRPLDLAGCAPGRVWVWDESTIGGNKIRKLEWLLGDAVAAGRRGAILCGPTGSNWVDAAVRETRRIGLAARVVLFPKPTPPYALRNLERTRAAADEVVSVPTVVLLPSACWSMLRRHPDHALFPPGGSSVRGSLGHVGAALELEARVEAGDLPVPSWIFVAAGSGGTAAGLAAGLELTRLPTRVAAVRVTDLALMNGPLLSTMAHRILAHVARTRARGVPRRLRPDRLTLLHDWFGAGYALPTEEAHRAVAAAEPCRLALETTYTGKALAALLSRAGSLDGPLLYWHSFGGG